MSLISPQSGWADPLYRQIATHLMKMVKRHLAPGDRLPGSRDLSSSLGLSRNTVVLAYDLLEDEGLSNRGRRGPSSPGRTSR